MCRLIAILFVLMSSSVFAQQMTVKGYVRDAKKDVLVNATIHEKHTGNATFSDESGYFELHLKKEKSTLLCSMVGFLKQEIPISIAASEVQELEIVLQPDPDLALDEVVIVGKSELRQVQESGFNVVAIDAKPFHNASVSLSQVLDTAPGVKIQQEGGMGSRTNVTINGLSGRHVRFFIDGMPMDAMSSAFQINNLPVNLAERIEVYKGVVPVNFGSDALGGAVNIVTRKSPGSYLDASYSYGSFNTHMTFINAGFTSEKGFTAQLSAYQNYSDNNYFVDVTIKDFETNLLSKETQRVRRFHDAYRNETLIAKVGLVDKPFADQLLFGFTFGDEYDEIQHPAYLNLAFGEKYQTSTILMPSFLYRKEHLFAENLNFNLAANYNLGGGHNYDLSDKEYNWLGESKHSNSPGEIQYSNYEYKNNNGTLNANLNYLIRAKTRLTLNNVSNFFARKGDEKMAVDDYINQKPRINNRNILGASLNSDWNSRWSTSVFGKMYSYKASAYLNLSNQNGIDNFQTITKRDTKFGYGLTSTYFLWKDFQLKANYEQTARLPVSSELFGEVFGFYIANFDLRPEVSRNVNVGFNYNWPIAKNHALSTDINFFYRKTTDFIRLNINYSQGEGSYENTQLVKTPGVDAEFRYSYKKSFTGGASLSYLQPRNFTAGTTYYKSLLPNQPNFFTNLHATYFLNNVWLKDSRLSLRYNLQFIDAFLYDYNTYQAANRATVPQQMNHSLFLTYSWDGGKYNLSVDSKNLLDAKLYDNYSLQKPGRSFSVKFRCFFNKI
ncbi:TonB-dependent receptor [Marinilongibacter aquaticus]|uniref:TonB-dependent receptor n=1 Tax=Marinilongibacter aquaticus TaxID=2975157 RepID=UPI0021BDB525|nr:TonB-dependent receptor [Marinilongibacter aquaticus]UBM58635.1 TonB-dependent receptor [Marinilongibacter aquaticus]